MFFYRQKSQHQNANGSHGSKSRIMDCFIFRRRWISPESHKWQCLQSAPRRRESNFKQQLCIQITFGTVISHSFMGYLTNKRSDHYANHHSGGICFHLRKKHLQNPFEEPYHFGIRKPSKTWRLTAVERRKDMPILCKHTGPQPVMDPKGQKEKILRISEKGKLQINFKKSWCPQLGGIP